MVAVSWWLNRRYYPTPYDWRRIGEYRRRGARGFRRLRGFDRLCGQYVCKLCV